MEKKIVGILVCIIMLIPVLSTTTTAAQTTELKIGTVDEGLLVGIAVLIENIGENDAENVQWSIEFEEGTILLPLGGTKRGSFDIISAGERESIFSGPVFGIGLLRPALVTVTVSASNAETVEESVSVMVFLFYTFVL